MGVSGRTSTLKVGAGTCENLRMQDVETPLPAPPDTPGRGRPPRRRTRRGRILRILGLVLIAGALGVGGYIWWSLWGTGFAAEAAQNDLRTEFEPRIDSRVSLEAPPPRVAKVPGDAVAIIRIPKIDLDLVVVEGTGTEPLKKGPGHYTDTAYPWDDTGRVGIAGHRTTYGAPFWSLNELREGDLIVLATEYGIFEYRVTRSVVTPPSGILPSGDSVLAQTNHPTLVLTTCNPRFSAAERLIVIADRVEQR
jgi:sortase A